MRTIPPRLGAVLAVTAATVLMLTGCADAIRNADSGAGSEPETPAPSVTAAAGEVQIFEDFACPHCAAFHEQYGGMVHGLVSGGQAHVDYRIVDFLGRGDSESWSTRAATAYYCLEDSLGDGEAAAGKLHGFQSWLFEQATTQPDDEALVAQAGELAGGAADAGDTEEIGQCISGDGSAERVEAAMSDFTDFGLRGVPSVYSPAQSTLYDPQEHGDLKPWLTGQVSAR